MGQPLVVLGHETQPEPVGQFNGTGDDGRGPGVDQQVAVNDRSMSSSPTGISSRWVSDA